MSDNLNLARIHDLEAKLAEVERERDRQADLIIEFRKQNDSAGNAIQLAIRERQHETRLRLELLREFWRAVHDRRDAPDGWLISESELICAVQDMHRPDDCTAAAAEACLAAVRDWATTNHGGKLRPIDVWPGLAAALAVPAGTAQPETWADPESYCHRCGRPNVAWFAPNDVWNRGVGTPEDTCGNTLILCPVCFVQQYEQRHGTGQVWRLHAEVTAQPEWCHAKPPANPDPAPGPPDPPRWCTLPAGHAGRYHEHRLFLRSGYRWPVQPDEEQP